MRELIQAEQALGDYTRKHARHILTGELGNNAGTVDHPTRTNFVYVKLHGDDNQVVEAEAVASFPHQAGIIVAVELVKRNAASRYQVLGIASNILFVGSLWAGTVGEHAAQHQRRDLGEGGFDPLDIYDRALVNLRGRAQATPDLTLYVERGFYFIGGALYEWTGGNSAAFAVPAGSFGVTVRRCDLLYIGSDQALHITQGATTSDGSVPAYPTTPYPCIPIAYVYLTSSSTSIQEDNIKDARVILTASDGTPIAHNLLSTTHGDTLAASVVAGDLIIGNDTPKWSRLAITVPAANVRNVVAVDNGETKPSWKAALDGTAAADIAAAGAAGTSLVFSHRDHAHRGVVSVNKAADTTLYGAVTLSAGANVTLTQVGQDIAIAAAGGSGHTIQDEGTPLAARANLNFVGAGVTVTDDAGNGASVVTIPAGGAHDILGASHSDTLADTVVDGDVIIGNVTPKWSRLAISVPAANVRNVLGVDNGELRPSWKAALDATNPATLTASAAAAPGTSLVFAHRDHVHPITNTSVGAASTIMSTDVSGGTTLTGILLIKPSPVVAGIALDSNSATGDFTLSLSPGNLVGNRRWTFGSIDAVVAGGAGTLTVTTTNDVATATHTHAITSSSAPGAAAVILASDGAGKLTLVDFEATNGVNGDNYIQAGDGAVEQAIRISNNAFGLNKGLITIKPANAVNGNYTVTLPNAGGAIALGAGTLSASSVNSATIADHTHAITSSSNPGAAASLLATDGSGNTTLQKLTTQNIEAIDSYYAGQYFAGWVTFRSRGTIASPSQTLSGDELANVNARGYHNGGAYTNNLARVYMAATENFTSTAQGTSIQLIATPNGSASAATVCTLQSGIQVGAPTGGDKGAGTANFAGDIYKNNTAYTNPAYALEHWATGRIVRHADKAGAVGYRRLSLAETETYIRKRFELPGHLDDFGLFTGGDWMLEKLEEAFTHLIEIDKRVAKLEIRN